MTINHSAASSWFFFSALALQYLITFKSYVTVEFFACVGMRVYVTLRHQLSFIFTIIPLKLFENFEEK